MPISVTTTESSETITTWVNGRQFERTEVTKIYVIEPLDPSQKTVVNNSKLEERLKTPGAVEEARVWRIWAIAVIWVVWMAYVYFEYARVSHGRVVNYSIYYVAHPRSERPEPLSIALSIQLELPSRKYPTHTHTLSPLSITNCETTVMTKLPHDKNPYRQLRHLDTSSTQLDNNAYMAALSRHL